jgi:hypothetical protein
MQKALYVMLNSVQHLIELMIQRTLKQVQGDK